MELLALLDVQTVSGFLEAGGYIVLFGLLLACGMGLPLPEDIPLIVSGALIAKGQMHWVHAGVAAWCGIIGGDLILYYLGHRFGRNITNVPFVGKHINAARLDSIEKRFHQWGVLVVAVGRLFAGVRGVMVVTAGTIRYPLLKFIIADGLAALVSGGLFMLLGYWFANNMAMIIEKIKHSEHIVLMSLIAVVIVGAGLYWWMHRRKKAKAAAAAMAEGRGQAELAKGAASVSDLVPDKTPDVK